MKKLKRRLKKKPILVFSIIFFILLLISSICLVYSILNISNIENILRYLVSILILFIVIYLFITLMQIIYKGKNAGIILLDIVFVFMFIIFSYSFSTINNIYGGISNIYKETTTYEVVAISKNDINNINKKKIGIINENSKKEINEISIELINDNNLKDNNEVITYESYSELISELYNNNLDIALFPSNYVSMFSIIDKYKDINEETSVLFTKSKSIKKDDSTNKKNTTEPFTILLLGMDSTISDISTVTSFNADSLILITFNPETYNATILSIPRDTYVPIGCLKDMPESKITHSGWNGESCVIKTINKWMDIDIDYYIKVNFTALVKLVDSIGGIEVMVPYSFCEQNSERLWGDKTVYVKKGLQTLNGEQALALSRNRHPNPEQCSSEWTNYYSDDLVRGENQQLVLNAVINKIIKNLNIENIYSIIDVIDTNVDTNMQIDKITSYYSVLKDIALKTLNTNENIINFEKLQLSTYGKYMYDPLIGSSGISMQIYYKDSFNKIVEEMKTNLELVEPNYIKEISFSINNPFKSTVIGSGNYTQDDILLVPNFVGKTKEEIELWANNNNIKLSFEYKDSDKDDDIVISQDIIATYRLDKIDKSKTYNIVLSNYKEE